MDLYNETMQELGPANHDVRIAVAHGQVDTLSPDTSRPNIITRPRLEKAVDVRKFHYIGLGDPDAVTEFGKIKQHLFCNFQFIPSG